MSSWPVRALLCGAIVWVVGCESSNGAAVHPGSGGTTTDAGGGLAGAAGGGGAPGTAGSGPADAGGAGGASILPCPTVAGAEIAITGKCLYECQGTKTDAGLLTGPIIPTCQLSQNQAWDLGVFAPAYCVTTTTDPRCD